ncbi:MAG: WGR domain-containing protein [Algibacter sp.]
MKVLQQKILYFTEGKSDKVYEVDLCESGADLFVVNFRYGRRGANLRDGTKTIFPVTYEEALKTFNSLVASKEKKGYADNGAVVNLVNDSSKKAKVNIARENTILKYLKEATSGSYTRDWKVSRIIWRASTLNIIDAAPLIANFITSDDEFEQYASIYALSKFKDTSYVEPIYTLFEAIGFDNKVGRIAASYILNFGDETYKSKLRNAILNALPETLIGTIGNPDTILNALIVYYLKDEGLDASVLYYMYLFAFNDDILRRRLYEFIEKLPVKFNTFKSIRYIYRASHIMEDVNFFGLISKKISVSNVGYSSSYLHVNGQWITSDVEKKKPNPSIAFSKKTKDYFNKTTYALVYDLSKFNVTGYVKYAVALLTSLNDKLDNKTEEIQYNYRYDSAARQYITEKTYYPKYHDFLALMYILYGGSERLQRESNKWFYTEVIDVEALPREDALSEIWNSKPNEVVEILANAKSDEAVQFSLRIIQDNTGFLEDVSVDILAKLVSHYHPRVLHVILDVVEKKYQYTQPVDSILLALLESKNKRAIELSLNWLKRYEFNYFSESDFVAKLALSGSEDVILYLKAMYSDRVKYNLPLTLLQLEPLFKIPSVYDFEYLIQVNDLIGNTNFGKLLSTVTEEKIKDLASSNSTTNKLFAANLAKHNTVETYRLFKEAIDGYINSEEASLRQVGIELLSHFPDEFLLKNHQKISEFCFSEYDEVRDAIQPTVEKLMRLDNDFKINLFKALLNAVSNVETYESLHQNCYILLTGNYKDHLSSIPDNDIFELILSNYEFAQKLGLPLFKSQVDLKTVSIKDLVLLAGSDILEVREIIHQYFNENIDKINYDLEDALLIFNSSWEDVIDWSCEYFDKNIKSENWTVNMLLYACDHTKIKVQAFGRKMITKHFTDDKGLPLLLKLQEHPTKDMQFFVTNYLDNYAKDHVDVILKLENFFKISLFNINTNRATKTRIYAFLEQESIKNKAVSEMTVRLINSVLGTNTIKDKSHNIDVLLTILDRHPDLDVPLLIKSNLVDAV